MDDQDWLEHIFALQNTHACKETGLARFVLWLAATLAAGLVGVVLASIVYHRAWSS